MPDPIKVTKVVDYVPPKPREWAGQNGVVYFQSAIFADGEEGSVGCNNMSKVAEVQASLEALKGRATEFLLEDKGEYNGQRQWKLKDWPGKPQLGGGGGGGGRGMSDKDICFITAGAMMGPDNTPLDVGAMAEMLLPVYKNYIGAPAQAEAADPAAAPATQPVKASAQTVQKIKELAFELGKGQAELLAAHGVGDLTELPEAVAEQVVVALTAEKAAG